jgi:hypothetical protein
MREQLPKPLITYSVEMDTTGNEGASGVSGSVKVTRKIYLITFLAFLVLLPSASVLLAYFARGGDMFDWSLREVLFSSFSFSPAILVLVFLGFRSVFGGKGVTKIEMDYYEEGIDYLDGGHLDQYLWSDFSAWAFQPRVYSTYKMMSLSWRAREEDLRKPAPGSTVDMVIPVSLAFETQVRNLLQQKVGAESSLLKGASLQ